MTKICDIPRNNVDAAMAYYREQIKAGTLSNDRLHTLFHMQDNPDLLIAAMNAESAAGQPDANQAG